MVPPIRTVAVALLAGVVVGRWGGAASESCGVAPAAAAAGATVAAAAIAVAVGVRRRPVRGAGPAPRTKLLAVAAVLALAAGVVRGTPAAPPELALPSFDVAAVRGTVISGPDLLRATSTEDGERRMASMTVDLGPCEARVLFEAPPGGPAADLLPGDRVRVVGRVRPRSGPSNPGERSGRAGAALDVQGASIERVDGGALGPVDALRRAAERLRRTTRARLCEATGGETRAFGVFLCLLTGDRSALPPDVSRAFRDSGTAHLLAVSGLHLVLLAGVLAAVGRRLAPEVVRRRAGLPALAVAMLLYTAMCRFETPVVRSAVFLIVGAVGRTARRRTSTLDHLSLAAAIVAAAAPAQIEDVGFQLSFAAVAGISLLARPYRDALFPSLRIVERFPGAISRRRLVLWRAVAAGLATSVAAQAATSPVVAARFGTTQPAGLVANVVAVPVFAVVLPIGLGLAAVGGTAPALTAPVADAIAGMFVAVLDSAALLPAGHVALGRPPPVLLAAGLALLVVGIRRTRGRRRDLAWPAAAWVAVGLLPGLATAAPAAEVVALDVGHGLGVLVRSAAGGAILYDAGGRSAGVGERVIVPALRALGVRELDLLCLSHEDIDHCGAAADVLREIRVGRVVVPSGFGVSPAAASVLDACRAAGVPVEGMLTGDVVAAAGLRADALHPGLPATGGAENVDSLVLHVTADDGRGGALTVLLTGDLEGSPLDLLAERSRLPPAAVLVLPHHGRGDPSVQERLAARIGAEISIASGSDGSAVFVADAWIMGSSGAIRRRAGRPAEVFPWDDP